MLLQAQVVFQNHILHHIKLQAVFTNLKMKIKKKIQLLTHKAWIHGSIKQPLKISVLFPNGMISWASLHHHFQVMNTEQADTEIMIAICRNPQTKKTQLLILKAWILGYTKQQSKMLIHFLNGMILSVSPHLHFQVMNMVHQDIEFITESMIWLNKLSILII